MTKEPPHGSASPQAVYDCLGVTAMTSLTKVIEQIQEEIQVQPDGKGKASIRATARLAGVDDESVRKVLFRAADLKPPKLAEILMSQGFDPADLNEWRTEGIPDIAIAIILEYYAYDAGRYCTPTARQICKAFMAVGIRVWMQQIKGWKNSLQVEVNQTNDVIQNKPRIESIAIALDLVFAKTEIHPNLIAGVKANEIGKHHPELAGTMESAKKLLPLPVEDCLLTVTKLSELYSDRTGVKLSARKMNQRLKELGLQYENPNKEPAWLATELGEPHAQVILQEAIGNNKTIQQLRWFPSVLEMLN
jgi:hypothetical protein